MRHLVRWWLQLPQLADGCHSSGRAQLTTVPTTVTGRHSSLLGLAHWYTLETITQPTSRPWICPKWLALEKTGGCGNTLGQHVPLEVPTWSLVKFIHLKRKRNQTHEIFLLRFLCLLDWLINLCLVPMDKSLGFPGITWLLFHWSRRLLVST